jgi:hypothetical protein
MLARLLRVAAAVAGMSLLAAAPAFANLDDEVASGRSVAAQLQDGKATCSTLSDPQFEHLGEYVMDRMAGSRAAHAAMNRRMSEAVGSENTERMHGLMGRSFAGCVTSAGSGVPMGPGMMADAGGGWGPMMSGSAWSWMHDGSWRHMSQGDWRRLGASMMGPGYAGAHHGWSAAAIVAIALGTLLLAALLLARRPRPRPPAAASSA